MFKNRSFQKFLTFHRYLYTIFLLNTALEFLYYSISSILYDNFSSAIPLLLSLFGIKNIIPFLHPFFSCRKLVEMETGGVIEFTREDPGILKKPPLPSPFSHGVQFSAPSPSHSPTSISKSGHQRNLSLDFRSMGIILPPLAATIQPQK